MTESPNNGVEIVESGRARRSAFLTKARRVFGGVVAFVGGSFAYVGAEGNNLEVMGEGAFVTLVGLLLADVISLPRRKDK